jgi:hypothetical protein
MNLADFLPTAVRDPEVGGGYLELLRDRPSGGAAITLTTPQALDPLLDYLRGRATGVCRHTPQVYLFDRQARLRVRTVDMPSPTHVATAIQELDALG